jgi:hypothetical protein
MRTVALAAALAFACVSVSAEARLRQYRSNPGHRLCVETGTVLHPACGAGDDHRSAGEGPRFIRGRLVCAVNVGAELARRGIRGTGSARAKSYLSWGRASRPVPGVVAVFITSGRTAR